jgi:two-component system, OmpR family, heavy metal sensor histidine kinase CusS
MSLSFKNRVAFHFMIATAIIMAIAFIAIYFVVNESVFRNLDSDLSFEAQKHTNEIKINEDSIKFNNKAEWEEREHREIQVNPVFVQLVDKKGRVTEKSPNLKQNFLTFKNAEFGGHFNSQINQRAIRQLQLPIEQDGKIKGYIIAAISSESAISTLFKLRNVLIVSYLMALVGLYFISRYLSGQSISPVKQITKTITRITKSNLKERVDLPQNKDEIYVLATSFNSLLDRIENTLEREKQFTSDASHELRTPLASLRGTLEVLIRKPRSQEEYVEKIKFSLTEINKMASTLEQLLLLARLESNLTPKDKIMVALPRILDKTLERFKSQISDKNLKINFLFSHSKKLLVPQYYTELIIENLLSNAIKYSNENSEIKINIDEIDLKVKCTIQDYGCGIKQEDLAHVYDSFFRSDALNHKQITGNGLGLSIVKKCADAINTNLNIESVLGKGTTVTITF